MIRTGNDLSLGVMKFNPSGFVIWNKVFYKKSASITFYIKESSDNNYIIAGSINVDINRDLKKFTTRPILLKLDPHGDIFLNEAGELD